MAHVMIPAREDVEAGAIHHSGTQMHFVSLTGDGCEVEQINPHSFVIRVPQASFDALSAITDLSPVWDALQDLESTIKEGEKESKDVQESVATIKDALALYRLRIVSLEQIAGRLLIDIDGLTANQHAARQKQTYVTLAAFIGIILSFMAMGLALWTLKT